MWQRRYFKTVFSGKRIFSFRELTHFSMIIYKWRNLDWFFIPPIMRVEPKSFFKHFSTLQRFLIAERRHASVDENDAIFKRKQAFYNIKLFQYSCVRMLLKRFLFIWCYVSRRRTLNLSKIKRQWEITYIFTWLL